MTTENTQSSEIYRPQIMLYRVIKIQRSQDEYYAPSRFLKEFKMKKKRPGGSSMEVEAEERETLSPL